MMAVEPYRLSACQALELIRSNKLTVEDYAKSLLGRIEERDSVVHAWAYLDPEYVLSQARRLDQIAPGKRGPLHGIAIGVKDIMLTKDMPTQHNSPIYKDDSPAIDASAVATLRAHGALIFGKTTTTEFASTMVGGPCCNPHDPERTPGGSSSGSAAAVADFQAPIALGTQTGGSIVRLASFNGVWGLKPTWGAISREGLKQCSVTLDTFGFFARSVEDLELFTKIFQIEDDEPPLKSPFSLKGAKFAMCETPVWPLAGEGTKKAMTLGAELLRKAGAQVQEIDLPPDFASVTEWHTAVLAGEGRASFMGDYLVGGDKLDPVLRDYVQNTAKMSRRAQLAAYDGCARLRPVIDSIAAKYDAIITPSVVDEAPLGISHTGDAAFCKMWTILHVPSVNVPGFAGEDGLPIGLTLVAPRYQDINLLHVAQAVGDVFKKGGGF